MHKLLLQKCYLSGAMDRCPEGGIPYRKKWTKFLKEFGVIVLDPSNKPFEDAEESMEARSKRRLFKQAGNYDMFAKEMKELRNKDLRMVDGGNFQISHIDTNIYACGTIEEISLANRQKKPVLIICEQGKSGCPDWLFGMLPHEMIFDNDEQCLNYLRAVDQGLITHKRWVFFNLVEQTKEVLGG